MNRQNEALEDIGRAFVPKKMREPLRQYMLKAGYEKIPYPLFAIIFFGIVILTLIIHFVFLLPKISGYSVVESSIWVAGLWLLGLLGFSFLAMFFIWSYLNIQIYNRVKLMEERLPDYLSLVVTNLRSGMSFDKSLWSAIRPEFGVLAKEVGMASKQVMTGMETGDALREFMMRYESPILRRSMGLVVSELESGGEIAGVIEKIINNLRKTTQLKREMAASVVSYMMFISIIVMVLAPVLFALANTILHVILGFAVQIAATPSGAISGGAASGLIESLKALSETGDTLTQNFRYFTYAALATIGIFAAMIVSIIEKGDIKGGLKYIPVFATVAMLVFFVADKFLASLFGALI